MFCIIEKKLQIWKKNWEILECKDFEGADTVKSRGSNKYRDIKLGQWAC